MGTMEIKIRERFRTLIPPLSADEYRGLEESILAEGCRDALILWNDTLIDGHNRYEICTKHNLPFRTEQKEFKSEDDAVIWIIDNQLARRNIDKWTKFDLNKAKEEIVAKQAKERQATSSGGSNPHLVEKVPQADSGQKTRDIMGKSIGVSGKTYEKMKVIDKEASPEIKKMVRDGDISTDKAFLMTKGITDKSPRQAQKEIIEKADAEKEKRPTWFKMFLSTEPVISEFSNEAVGVGLKTAMRFFATGEIPDEKISDEAKAVFLMMQPAIYEAFEEYQQAVENGKVGAQKRKENEEKRRIEKKTTVITEEEWDLPFN